MTRYESWVRWRLGDNMRRSWVLLLLGLGLVTASALPATAAGPWFGPVSPPIEVQQQSMRLFATGTDRFAPGLIFGSATTGTTTVLASAGRDGSLTGKAVVDVSTNNSGTCALDDEGGLHCWGDAQGFNRFQTGENVDAADPVVIGIDIDGQPRPVTDVAVSDEETCVVSWLKPVCWGHAAYMYPVATAPTVVPGAPDSVQIDADAGKVCAIGTDSSLWCWGTTAAELGVNKTDGLVDPTRLAGSLAGKQVTSVSVGEDVSCAIDSMGGLHCWGVGAQGVGTGASGDVLEPVLVRGSLAGQRVVNVSVGPVVHAVDSRGRLHQWSGTGTPALSRDLGALAGRRVLSVSGDTRGDASHVCVTDLAGDVYCRGFNAYGRLGIGGDPEMYGVTERFTKMLPGAARGLRAVQVEAGAEYTFVVSARPLFAPLSRATFKGSTTFRLDALTKALGTGSVGAQAPATVKSGTATMPVESTSSTQVRLSGALTLKTADGVQRVLSGGLIDLDTGAVSFVVQGIGWPYDGNRITLFVADVEGKVKSTTKGKQTRVTVQASAIEMGNVKDFPGDAFFPGEIFFPGDIWFPGDAFDPDAPVGSLSGSWTVQKR